MELFLKANLQSEKLSMSPKKLKNSLISNISPNNKNIYRNKNTFTEFAKIKDNSINPRNSRLIGSPIVSKRNIINNLISSNITRNNQKRRRMSLCEAEILEKFNEFISSKRKSNNKMSNSLKFNKKLIKLIFKEKKYRCLSHKFLVDDSLDDTEEEDGVEFFISTENIFIFIFDLLIIITNLYELIVIPFNLAKNNCFCDNHINENYIYLFINYFIDTLYIIDFLISFLRPYYNYEYKLIKTTKKIISHYFFSMFFLDFLEAIPFFTISHYICINNLLGSSQCFTVSMSNILIFIKICSILKSLKIMKIMQEKKNRALDDFYEFISENFYIEKLTNFILYLLECLFALHIFICLHIFFGKRDIPNWIIKTGVEDCHFSEIYMTSFYFIITTMTTVGYGDITCTSFIERIFQIILLAIGIIAYSFIISEVGNHIKNESYIQEKLTEKENVLEKIRITYPLMPFKLYSKIHSYLLKDCRNVKKNKLNFLLDSLPDKIKSEVLFSVYKEFIKNFRIFKGVHNSNFIFKILSNLIQVTTKRNDLLVVEGDMVENIIFVKDGRLALEAKININNPYNCITKYFYENFKDFSDESKLSILKESSDNSTLLINNNNNSKLPDSNKNLEVEKYYNLLIDRVNSQKNMTSISAEPLNFEPDTIKDSCISMKNFEKKYENNQYIKILDIRKNEHFGDIYITLKKPAPLSLRVKSKIAEIFVLNKKVVLNLSKSYIHVWKRISIKSYKNTVSLKFMTRVMIHKFCELNGLCNIEEINELFEDHLENKKVYKIFKTFQNKLSEINIPGIENTKRYSQISFNENKRQSCSTVRNLAIKKKENQNNQQNKLSKISNNNSRKNILKINNKIYSPRKKLAYVKFNNRNSKKILDNKLKKMNNYNLSPEYKRCHRISASEEVLRDKLHLTKICGPRININRSPNLNASNHIKIEPLQLLLDNEEDKESEKENDNISVNIISNNKITEFNKLSKKMKLNYLKNKISMSENTENSSFIQVKNHNRSHSDTTVVASEIKYSNSHIFKYNTIKTNYIHKEAKQSNNKINNIKIITLNDIPINLSKKVRKRIKKSMKKDKIKQLFEMKKTDINNKKEKESNRSNYSKQKISEFSETDILNNLLDDSSDLSEKISSRTKIHYFNYDILKINKFSFKIKSSYSNLLQLTQGIILKHKKVEEEINSLIKKHMLIKNSKIKYNIKSNALSNHESIKKFEIFNKSQEHSNEFFINDNSSCMNLCKKKDELNLSLINVKERKNKSKKEFDNTNTIIDNHKNNSKNESFNIDKIFDLKEDLIKNENNERNIKNTQLKEDLNNSKHFRSEGSAKMCIIN